MKSSKSLLVYKIIHYLLNSYLQKASSKKLITPSTSPVKVPNRGVGPSRGVSPRRMISPRRLISPWRDVGSSRGGVSPRRGVGKQNDVVSDEQTELTIDMSRTSYGIADTQKRRQKNELEVIGFFIFRFQTHFMIRDYHIFFTFGTKCHNQYNVFQILNSIFILCHLFLNFSHFNLLLK